MTSAIAKPLTLTIMVAALTACASPEELRAALLKDLGASD
jgi:hypothetical protein